MHPLYRAAAGYIEHLGLELVIADENKKPYTDFFPHGVSSATRDLRRIERCLRRHPRATLAARVGNNTVLDTDQRHGGPAHLAKLLAYFGPLPETWLQETPTGGFHIWFLPLDFKPKGMLATGIECLTGNRLVTLSPSERAAGRYRWLLHPLRTPLAEAPRWIVDAVRPAPAPQRPKRENKDDDATREKRARAYLAKMDVAVQGNHGAKQTFFAAMCVVRGFDLDENTAFSVLGEWNQMCDPPWNDRELKRKIREAKKHGSMEWGALLDRERRAA